MVVWSCGSLGVEVANRLLEVPEIDRIDLITAPWRFAARPSSAVARLRRSIKQDGAVDTARSLLGRLIRRSTAPVKKDPLLPPAEAIHWHTVEDLHSEQGLALVRDAAPDLGVVAGTYILREKLFEIPKLGSINLHSGKVPEYRGSAPGFWELYNGETEVGITIHRVAKKLDAGDVWLQEVFPLDSAPDGDPLHYLERYREEVLRPNGIRMVAEVVSGIARGDLTPNPQDVSKARTYRMPDYRTKRELIRRVRMRRK